jgi:hypothetical protein
MELINKYKGKTAATTGQTGTSLESGGEGVVRQDMNLQAAQAQQNRAIMKEAGTESATAQIMDEQRKQSNLQRDDQITQLGQQSRAEKQKYEMKATSILDNLEAQRGKMSQAEQMDQMEAASSYLRLQDEKYRYDIADVGRRKRLDNAGNFDMELQAAIFDDESELLKGNMDFQAMLGMDDREFRKAVANIDLQMALDVSTTQAKSASEVATISAGGSAVTTAVSAYNTKKA